MGLFSSKKKIYVASSVWNMAGDEDDIPKVLPSLTLASVLGGDRKTSLGETILKGLSGSTFMKSRTFQQWAMSNYHFGVPTGGLSVDRSVLGTDLGPAVSAGLGLAANQQVRILVAEVEDLDLTYWAEAYLLDRFPDFDLENQIWDVSFDYETDRLIITRPNATYNVPAEPDLLWAMERTERKLLYVGYNILTKQPSGSWTTSNKKLFTYRMGSGNAVFDALKPPADEENGFCPVVPLRLDNVSISEHAEFANVKRAYRKLTGGKIEKILEEIEDNDNIDDMDFIFVVPGIPLNTKKDAAKAYIYEFLKALKNKQRTSVSSSEFIANRRDETIAKARWENWNIRVTRDPDRPPPGNSFIGLAQDNRNELKITMPDLPEFDFRIRWKDVREFDRVGNGARFDGNLARPLMSKGSYMMLPLPSVRFVMPAGAPRLHRLTLGNSESNRIVIIHQYARARYRMLEVSGLVHENRVYRGKSVHITANEALEDDEQSGFLLPLHIPTMRNMGVVQSANLSGYSMHLVVNSYKVVKKKWWQRGIFRIVMIVVMIAVTVMTGGVAGLAGTAGILGTNAAVGALLGATGVMGAVLGAVVNGIAGVILTTVVSKASTAVFGEKWGALLSTVLTVVAGQLVHSFATTGDFGVDWGAMLRVDSLMELTNSVTGVYGAMLQADTLGIQEAMVSAQENYDERMKEIEEQSREILGMTSVYLDTTILTDAAEHFGETPDTFLNRTLMTGSDIAQMSHMLIEGFSELSLELPGLV